MQRGDWANTFQALRSLTSPPAARQRAFGRASRRPRLIYLTVSALRKSAA